MPNIEWHERDEPFRLFAESVQGPAIFMLGSDGRVVSWNAGAERIKGYKASEIIGQHFSCFYPKEDVRSEDPQRLLVCRKGRGTC